MNVKVYYVSPKGCAEVVAEAIARECKCTKEPLMPAYPPENVAMMFLGCEGAKADTVTLDFINSLNKNRVRNAALFCCNPKKDDVAINQMRAALEAHGVHVLANAIALPGKGFLSGKKPGPEDIHAANEFAKESLKHIEA